METTKIYGEMTPQEINLLARNLKRNGEFDEIKILAEENQIKECRVLDFIKGNTLFLINPQMVSEPVKQTQKENDAGKNESGINVSETADSKEQMIIDPEALLPDKSYASAEEKLLDECEQMCKNIKDDTQKAIMQTQMKPVIDFINSSGDELKAKVLLNHKSWKRCFTFMSDKAKELRVNNAACVCVSDSTVFGWITEYYEADDRADVLEELRKAEETRINRETAKKKSSESKKKSGSKKAGVKKKTAKSADNKVTDGAGSDNKAEAQETQNDKNDEVSKDTVQMSLFNTVG